VYNPINIAAYEKAIVWATEYEKLGTGSSHASLLISLVCKTSFDIAYVSRVTVLHRLKYVNADKVVNNLAEFTQAVGRPIHDVLVAHRYLLLDSFARAHRDIAHD
jgi:hypothetical protein